MNVLGLGLESSILKRQDYLDAWRYTGINLPECLAQDTPAPVTDVGLAQSLADCEADLNRA